jgi:hypothetical protein
MVPLEVSLREHGLLAFEDATRTMIDRLRALARSDTTRGRMSRCRPIFEGWTVAVHDRFFVLEVLSRPASADKRRHFFQSSA